MRVAFKIISVDKKKRMKIIIIISYHHYDFFNDSSLIIDKLLHYFSLFFLVEVVFIQAINPLKRMISDRDRKCIRYLVFYAPNNNASRCMGLQPFREGYIVDKCGLFNHNL